MSSTTNNFSLFGDASSNQIAIWICGVALVLLLGAIIAKTKGPANLRFLTYCVLVGVFGILGFAYLLSDSDPPPSKKAEAPHQPAGSGRATQPPNTTSPPTGGEFWGNLPDYSDLNAKPAPLQSPHARSGVTDQTNG